ncbi:MAG TPA: hypothetical protein DCL29_02135 [Eubacterium sp.]|nr:hypothetical protein [Eubacterium sp.]
MGEGTGLSASDVALLNDGGLGNNSFIWLFAILALMGGGFGGWGNNGFPNAIGYENLATQAQVDRGFDNQNSMANQRDILAAVTSGTAQAVAATNQTFHDTVNVLQDKYGELQRDIAGVALTQANAIANQNDCCCSTKMLIQETAAQNRYDAAMNTASINANIAEQIQGVRDLITGNRMADMQNQINDLQLQNAMAGVVRYPNAWTYNAGVSPFCGCNCGMM